MGAIKYIVDHTFRLLRRQWFLSILTLLTAGAMFWMLGVISLTAINVQNMMNRLESELVVQVYLKKDVVPEAVIPKIKALEWVTEAEEISPEESLAKLESRLGQQSRATKLIGKNPLPWSITLKVTKAEDVDILAKTVAIYPEVDDVVYAGTFIRRLGKVSSLVNSSLLTMLILTLFITSLVIFNTIRISLFSQREEISIMSLVGATHGYIAFPFILQGMILSGIGSVFASVGLGLLYDSGVRMFQEGLPFVPIVMNSSVMISFYFVLILLGIMLGWVCSYVSVSRYISVATKPLLITLCLLSLSQFAFAAPAPSTTDLDRAVAEEEARMRQLEQKIDAHRRNAQQIGKQEKSVLGNLAKLEENTAILLQQNRVLTTKTDQLKSQIDGLSGEITKTRARISEVADMLSQRFMSMSRYGEMEHLNLVFSSENTHEAVNAVYLLNRLSADDQQLIEELLTQEKSLIENTERLQTSREQFFSQSNQLRSKQKEYNGAIQTTNKLLDEVRRQKSLQEQAAREAEEAQRQIGRTIAELMQRKRERLARERGGLSPTQQYTYLGAGTMLDWPIRGDVRSPFGTRVHPVFKTKSNHSGLDISAPAGTPVKAAGPGEVLYAGWQSGFGQVVIIDHGRDISTVYAHLGSINVREGSAVRAGTQIGGVGMSGTATGYHLHFEVRTGTTARNPLSYLKR